MPVQPLGGFSAEQVVEEPLTTWRCRSSLTMSSRSSVFYLNGPGNGENSFCFCFCFYSNKRRVTFTVYKTNYTRFAFHTASQYEILLVTRH